MLDIVPSTESRPPKMMSLDLTPYLLSASPPSSGFNLHSLNLGSPYSPYSFFSAAPNLSSPVPQGKVYGKSCAHTTPIKSIMSVNLGSDRDSSSADSQDLEQSPSPTNVSISSSRRSSLKKVSFADDMGRPLTEVRLMMDNPAAPPLFTLSGAAHLSNRSDTEISSSDEDYRPCLLPPEPQPLRRANFEEDLRRNMVAVENIIVRDLEVTCTVLIDNRPLSKRVFGRCTTDTWQTFLDVAATFSFPSRPGYDTYQFKYKVPSCADRSKSIQFAVCYEADGMQHWDNNEGNNFSLHWNRELEDRVAPGCSDNSADSLELSGSLWSPQDDLEHPYY